MRMRVVRPPIEARQADHEVATSKVAETHHLKESVVEARGWCNVHAATEPSAVRNGNRRGWAALRSLQVYADLRLVWRVVQTGSDGGETECDGTSALF
jgi:hypothetical protein